CTSFSYRIWVFNLQGTNQVTCFRIYRETLSRFSCAASEGDRLDARSALVEKYLLRVLLQYLQQEEAMSK
ncbi:hypothetical protein I5860_001670, partial [Clostridioides difficile]